MKNEKDKVMKSTPETENLPTKEGSAPLAKSGDKKNKSWTAVDTVIVLMILLALGGVILRSFVDWEKTGETPVSGPYYIDFVVSEIHPQVLEEIQSFDALYLYETGELVGYVGVYDDGSMALRPGSNPAAMNSTAVSAVGCMVTLEGVWENGSLLIKGLDHYISPGSVLNLRTDRAVLTVEITAIRGKNG